MKVLSKRLGLKARMPGRVPMSSVSVVVWLIVQLMVSVVMPSTPVRRVEALRLSSLWVFSALRTLIIMASTVWSHVPYSVCLLVSHMISLRIGSGGGNVYAKGGTSVRFIVA